MKKIITFLILILIVSCNSEQEELNNKFSYGEYDAISMVSNIPIDANFDGIYSTDFLNQFLSYSTTKGSSFKFFALDENNTSSLSIILQTMHRWPPEYQDDITNITTRGVFAHLSTIDGSILSAPFAIDQDGNPTETKLIDCKIIDNETIQLKFKHTLIYDIPTSSWITITVEGIYKKR